MDDPLHLSAFEIAARVRARTLSARDVCDAHLRRIEAVDPRVRAFLTVTSDAIPVRSPACPSR